MKSLRIKGRIEDEIVLEIFNDFVDEIILKENFQLLNGSLLIVSGSKYMFRTNDYVGFLVISQYDGSEQFIRAIMVGGGKGIMNLKWGAGSSLEKKFIEKIEEVAGKMSMDFSISE